MADFFNVIVWRQLAEICGRYLAKGRKVCVVGELQNRSYDAKDGTKRYVTEIVAEDVNSSPRAAKGTLPAQAITHRVTTGPHHRLRRIC